MSKTKSPALDPDTMLRPEQVPTATKGALTKRQAYRMITERRIPFTKPSGPTGPVLIRLGDLQRYLAERVVTPERG